MVARGTTNRAVVIVCAGVISAAVALVALAGCGDQPAPSAAPRAQTVSLPVATSEGSPPQFQPAWVPSARGSGNFEICLSSDAAENGINRVTVPDNVVMSSNGQLVAKLTERGNNDPRVMGSRDNEAHEAVAYAVITTRPVTLTTAEPCRITTVRAAVNDDYQWTHVEVPADLHFTFSPWPTIIRARVITTDYWGVMTGASSRGGVAGDAIAGEYFTGVVLTDAGDPVPLVNPAE